MSELVPCPKCGRQLKVPDTLIGEPVMCPNCQTAFTARRVGAPAGPAAPELDAEGEAAAHLMTATPPRPGAPAKEDTDEEDATDEAPSPRRKRRSRKRGPTRRFGGEPHRAPLVLILGIVSLCVFVCPLIGWAFGAVAWSMGHADLDKMNHGVMDASGAGLTRAGQICGIVGVVLSTFACCSLVLLSVVNK